MGCNCKNKNNEVKKIDVEAQDLQEVKHVALQTIQEMELSLEHFNDSPTAKQKIQNFMKDTFGEIVGNYCDTVCRKRLQGRLDKLKKDIQ